MSFSGPGGGISGTSNQFSVGYAQSSGNATYAASSNNATYATTSGNTSGSAASATNATNATYAQSAGNATYAQSAGSAYSAYYASGSTNAYQSVNASYAGNAGTAFNVQQAGNYPVWVTSGANIYAVIGTNGGYSQMFNNGVNYILGGQAAAYQGTFSGYFAYSVFTNGRFMIASDKRTKTKVTDEEKPQYLETVNNLQVERFTYKDDIKQGNIITTGFFAQDVETVIPGATKQHPEYIPSVMKKATAVVDKTITCPEHGFVIDDFVKLHVEEGEDGTIGLNCKVTKVIDSNTFEVDNDQVKFPLFVYGKLVDDFHTLDENKITPHTVGAIQELHELVKQLQKRVETLESLVIR